MKVATLMGSPRKKGNTARVLELFENLLTKNGHEVDRINIVNYEIKGCLGCKPAKMRDTSQVADKLTMRRKYSTGS